jgi:hypothetical protein
MKHKLATILMVVAAVVVATLSAATTTTRPALAAEGPTWPLNDYGTPRATDSVILKWDEQLLSTIRAYPKQTGPTITARALGVLHTATYDAWAAYDPTAKATRPGGAPQQDKANNTETNKNKAISYAAYRVLVDLFPPSNFPSTTSPKVYSTPDVLLSSLGYDPGIVTTDPSTPAGIGNLAAKLVLDFRRGVVPADGSVRTQFGDGSNQLGDHPNGNGLPYSDTTGYKSLNTWDKVSVNPNNPLLDGKWHWQPLCVLTPAGVIAWTADNNSVPLLTPPSCTAPNYTVQSYLTPQWKDVIPFASLSAIQYKVPGPPKNLDGKSYSTADIATELADTSNLDDVRKAKAEYWADGPGSEFPPGHTAVFAQAMSRKRGFTLDTDVKLFFAVGNAMLDASIAAWREKYKWDFVRPITAIREHYRGQMINSWKGPGKGYGAVPGEQWMPYQALNVVTPPFPEYVSGHSTFTGAGSQILLGFTGSDAFGASVTIPVGSLKIEPAGTTPAPENGPVTLSWPTFTAAADEAGWSRRYGGIHFKSGDEHGRMLGKMVGSNAWSKAQAYIKGYAGY